MTEVCAVIGLDLLFGQGMAMENANSPSLAAVPDWIALDSYIPRRKSQARMTPTDQVRRSVPGSFRAQGSGERNSTLFRIR